MHRTAPLPRPLRRPMSALLLLTALGAPACSATDESAGESGGEADATDETAHGPLGVSPPDNGTTSCALSPTSKATSGSKTYYRYASTTTTSWTTAKAACEAMGAKLATPTSAAENTAIRGTAGSKDLFIGVYQSTGQTSVSSGWVRADGAAASYTSWKSGQPDDSDKKESAQQDCALLSRSDGTWSDTACATKISADYVCEFSAAPTSCGGTSTCAIPSGSATYSCQCTSGTYSATNNDCVTGTELTLANCSTNIDSGAPAFFRNYFRCVTVTVSGTNTIIQTTGLPPHKSYYYGTTSANYTAFDYTRGVAYSPNPNKIIGKTVTITIPNTPVSKGLTVTSGMVDGTVSTNSEEYGLGVVGVALDSVYLFNPLAAPGDLIENEKYTFDGYSGHPQASGYYHYHTTTMGPLEVLKNLGFATTTTPGAAEVELYGILCDGTVVLGCKELDGTTPATGDLDAQNGHVHDLKDKGGAVMLAGRYHTHVCPGTIGTHKYNPEIQYYKTCNVQ